VSDDKVTTQPGGPLRALARERIVHALVPAAVMVLALAAAHNANRVGLHMTEYNWIRARWHHCADVVLVGDSRIMCGLSPAAMKDHLPALRILNYGLAGTAISETVYDQAEEVLDPDSAHPVMVVGITPAGLAGGAAWGAGPTQDVRAELERLGPLGERIEKLTWYFDPISLRKIFRTVFGVKAAKSSYMHLHADGWQARTTVPERPRRGLKEYVAVFRECTIQQKNIDLVLRRVRRWRARGVRVYGLRPPTTVEMEALENRLSGFDEQAFAEAFQAAGGIWLPMDSARYASYDGSHLRYDSAEDFSRDIARRIAADLGLPPGRQR